MSFSESLKVKIRKRASFSCCFCHKKSYLEIHHIIPQAEGGKDTEDNAAPLCPSCHATHGANPQMRKQIREMRDDWYEIVAEFRVSITKPIFSIPIEFSDFLPNLASKEDIERIAVRNESYVLGASQSSLGHSYYSFAREEFIHPLIVRELLGWISDSAETTVGVDLASSNRSNRFYGEFEVNERDGRSWVKWTSSERESFTYAYIATSPSGVEMVECYDWGGGSGVFGSVGLFCLEFDRALREDREGKVSTRERVILKTLGSIGLGDRYKGDITYEDGFLVIGPDTGWFKTKGIHSVRKLPVR